MGCGFWPRRRCGCGGGFLILTESLLTLRGAGRGPWSWTSFFGVVGCCCGGGFIFSRVEDRSGSGGGWRKLDLGTNSYFVSLFKGDEIHVATM